MLVGEYAVVDGAPAVVAAVDSGVAVTVHPAAERSLDVGDLSDAYARAALEAVAAPAGRYVFSAWRPVATAEKAGLGGSASAVVAAMVAGSDAAPVALFALAREVHHAVQGSGSGIDVAAACYGGVLRFEAGNTRATSPAWELSVVYSGAAPRTGCHRHRAAQEPGTAGQGGDDGDAGLCRSGSVRSAAAAGSPTIRGAVAA